jgi:anhydro-N-acetylmuramic acid kinase
LNPWARWEGLRHQTATRWIGLMSGTSLDGLDIALVTLRGHDVMPEVELEKFTTVPYPSDWQRLLSQVTNPERVTPAELCQFDVLFGSYCATLVRQQCTDWHIALPTVDAIASHGQTVLHLPPESSLRADLTAPFPQAQPATWQLGDPDHIAHGTGLPVVSSFRMKDLAGGGTGAPLLPYVDFLLFGQSGRAIALHNLGGISNVTYLPASGKSDDVLAFDTGPANVLMNLAVQELCPKQTHDENGALARAGSVCEALLSRWMQHPYFQQPPPKSTGREEFGPELLKEYLQQAAAHKLSTTDILATLTQLTVETIAQSYERYLPLLPETVFLSGGGAHNLYLCERLQQRLASVTFKTSDELGLPQDAREAFSFAVLGRQFLRGEGASFPGITGNQGTRLLGRLSLPG